MKQIVMLKTTKLWMYGHKKFDSFLGKITAKEEQSSEDKLNLFINLLL